MAVKYINRQQAVRCRGFSLIESIISIVILAIAMITLVSFLYPQIQDSARGHYEVRASALANSLMTEILARGYDHNSDPDGGIVRCGESDSDGNVVSCTTTLGPDNSSEVSGGVRSPENFNDVDDYIGCWVTNDASRSSCTTESEVGDLTDVLGDDIGEQYSNFVAMVSVDYATIDGISQFKKITVAIVAGRYGTYEFIAHRGNY